MTLKEIFMGGGALVVILTLVQISIALIVNTNVLIKPHPCLHLCCLHLVQLLNHCTIECLSNRPSDCAKHLSDG